MNLSKLSFPNVIIGLTLCVILLLSFVLRYDNFGSVPFPGESRDEYSNTWVGISLLTRGVPVGWSGIEGYNNQRFEYINVDDVYQNIDNGEPFAINWPWFDHPPVMGILTGSYARLVGIDDFSHTNMYIIRKPMVVVGVISVLLIFVYTSLVYDIYVGLLASLFYGISPLIVIGSRMIQAENLLIPWMLAALCSWLLFVKFRKEWLLWMTAILAGSAMLVKLSGVAVVIAIFILILGQEKIVRTEKLRQLVVFVPVSLSWLLLFFVYGAAYDWQQFLQILLSNSHRTYGIGSAAIYDMIVTNKITNTRLLTDGWVLAGWLGIAGLMVHGQRHKYVLVPLLSYLLVLVMFGSHPFGWYRFPLWGFLITGVAYWVVHTWRDWRNGIGLILLLVLIGLNVSKLIDTISFEFYVGWWKLLGLVVFGLMLLGIGFEVRNFKWPGFIVRLVLVTLVMGAIVSSVYYVSGFTPDKWYFVN